MHVVIGAGEVGQAIAEVLSSQYEMHLRDVEESGPDKAEVLHICFPYFDDFAREVRRYVFKYQPELVIVHSTVALGTCEHIYGAVHSPVRGRHPHLAESIRTFTKFFGGPRAIEAAALFNRCGIKTSICENTRDTEAGKLWELAQYGLAIVAEKAIHDYCEEHGVNFDIAYTAFAETYNAGYTAMGEPQYVRPLLTHMPGPIGGHCVVQNSRLIGHPLADLVVQAGQGAEKVSA